MAKKKETMWALEWYPQSKSTDIKVSDDPEKIQNFLTNRADGKWFTFEKEDKNRICVRYNDNAKGNIVKVEKIT